MFYDFQWGHDKHASVQVLNSLKSLKSFDIVWFVLELKKCVVNFH